MQNEFYYIATPAYNEAKNIGPFVRSLIPAVRRAKPSYTLLNTYICVNGCTDNTDNLIKNYIRLYPSLKIKLLHCPKGMNRAISKIISEIPNVNFPVVKIDADVRVKKDSLLILLGQLSKHPSLQIAGAYPRARDYKGKKLYKRILGKILDVRSRYPQSQVSVYDVKKFHKVALIDPQPGIPVKFELNSRIYFHGRFYAMRNKTLWRVPPERIGDDTYLTLDIYKRFGYNSIRLMYNAVCTYLATTSIKFHWKVYKRIFCDTYTLFDLPEFKNQKIQELKRLESVKLDWKYIRTLPFTTQICFRVYFMIKKFFSFWFHRSPNYHDKLWTYKEKTN
ncbi:glycosyltransferase [Patescibacteria group bacterium]|nr:glycosyltransferase [Patescibacteria group bacterium]